MKLKNFHKICESVILVDKLPDPSKLKQMVAGCVEAFGLCSKGPVIALNDIGDVVCIKAEVVDDTHLCGEDLLPCEFKSVSTKNEGLVILMNNFPIENFLTQEGTLPDKAVPSKKPEADPVQLNKSMHLSEEIYEDEDDGVSPFLAEDAAAIKRARLRKKKRKSKGNKNLF